MDSAATDDQRMLLETSERFIQGVHPLPKVRGSAFDDATHRSDYLRRSAELGWYSMLVPEELGGGSVTANGLVDATLIASKRGAGLQPGPFVGTNVVAHALARAGTDEQRSTILPTLIAGEATAAWAVGAPYVAASSGGEIRAASSGGDIELSGRATLVQDAASSSWLLVTAAGDDGPVQVLVAADTAGIAVVESDSLDLSRRFAEVGFDSVRVPASATVGASGSDDELVTEQVALACVLTAAETVGAMDRDFEMALQYAKDRIAFGRPIGSFQAIKHLLADTSLALEMSKAITLAAAEILGSGDAYGPQAAAMAKAFVSDSGIELAQSCFQVFGGIGFTWEHDQHLYLRRITTDALLFGGPDWQRERVCQLAGL